MTDDREEIRQDNLAQQVVEREVWLRSFGMTPYASPGDYDMARIKRKRAEFQEEKKIDGTLFDPYNDLIYTDARFSR